MSRLLGLPKGKIALHPHTSEWAQLYAEEEKRIRNAIGDWLLDIQHVGSTAIPGILAKPVIDIGVAVANFEEAFRCVQPLEALGYHYRGENGIPRRHYFVRYAAEREEAIRTHHLHMNEIHSSDWQQQIAFRDHLRQYPALAQEYAQLKTKLAEQFANDSLAYTEGKSGFINSVLSQAIPAPPLTVGQETIVRVFKSNQVNYRWWVATVESVSEREIITHTQPGLVVHQGEGGWEDTHFFRTWYWLDRPYNLEEVYRADGSLEEIYLNIASPTRIKNGEIHYTDYELDISRMAGAEAILVDEDEFAEAAQAFSYSRQFQTFCYQAAQDALTLANQWVARGM